jgi:hypothetical protein
MSTISAPAVTRPMTSRRTNHRRTRGGMAGGRWALLAALVLGVAGGAGVSAGLVHSQVRIVHDVRTVYVPVPTVPMAPASGSVQRKA